jgi:hypothetical protein
MGRRFVRSVTATLFAVVLFGAASQRVRADIMYGGTLMYLNDSLSSSCCSLEFFGPVTAFGGQQTYILAWFGNPMNWSSLFDVPGFAGNGPGTHAGQGSPANSSSCANMQTDGNFVLYNNCSNPVWHTSTSGNPGAFLNAQDDGNMVVYSSSSTVLWALY